MTHARKELLAPESDCDASVALLAILEPARSVSFPSDGLDLLQFEPGSSTTPTTTCIADAVEAHDRGVSLVVTHLLNQDKDSDAAAKRERQRLLSARRKQTHRARVKNELDELKDQAAEFELELYRLQAARAASNAGTCCDELATAWKHLAARNHKRRRAAERLNEQLTRKIARNSELLSDLARIPSSFSSEISQSPADQRSALNSKLCEDSLLLGFAQELDAVYAQTDEAMGRRFPSEPTALWLHSVSRRRHDDQFEVVDSFALPFGYAKVSRALWKSMAQVYETDPGLLQSEAIASPDSTIAVHFRVYGSTVTSSSLSCSFVSRRYVETDRTVVVWRALSEGLEGPLAGVATDETGWSVLRSDPRDDCFSVDGQGGTVMDTFVLLTPLEADAAKRRGRAQDFDAFVSRVISSVIEDGDAIAGLMNGLLLTKAPA